MVENKWSFLLSWVFHNLIGGYIGGIVGSVFVLFLSDVLHLYLGYYIEAVWLPVFIFSLSLGVCIGFAQKVKIYEAGFQTQRWEFTTTIGWVVSGLIYLIGFAYIEKQELSKESIYIYSVMLVLTGAIIISICQMLKVSQELSTKFLWGIANIVSFLMMKIIVIDLLILTDDFPIYFEGSTMLLCFLTTCLLPIPTGIVLLRMFSQKER